MHHLEVELFHVHIEKYLKTYLDMGNVNVAWKHIAKVVDEALTYYPTTMEEDRAILNSSIEGINHFEKCPNKLIECACKKLIANDQFLDHC